MAPNMAPNVAPNVEKDRAFQNVTPDKVALRVKDNHERRRKRFRFFIASESKERKMLWCDSIFSYFCKYPYERHSSRAVVLSVH